MGPTWARGAILGRPGSPLPRSRAQTAPRPGSSPKVRPPRPSTLASASGPSGAASPRASAFWALADFSTFLSLVAVSRPLVHSVCICCVSAVFIKRADLFPSDFVSVVSSLGFCSKITSRKKKLDYQVGILYASLSDSSPWNPGSIELKKQFIHLACVFF